MKLPKQVTGGRRQVAGTGCGGNLVTRHPSLVTGFTMVEVAISLAIIGVALVGIIGVLPLGLRTQRDSREDTIINQDATVFTEAISKGARGANDLTNYVYAITNWWTLYNPNGSVNKADVNGYTPAAAYAYGTPVPSMEITNGGNIVGLLSMPEYTDTGFNPTNNLFSGGYSNHVIAYVRSISGPAVEKPPQNSQILQQDSFSYRIFFANAPVAAATIYPNLQANLHELRLTFEWPLLPNNSVGRSRLTYRAMIAGQMLQTNSLGQLLYFYQPQSFGISP
jgi:type II secretory pathway pseudopilin PulG